MNEKKPSAIPDRFTDSKAIHRAIRAGVENMLRINKLLGLPVVGVRDGKPILIPPEEIVLDPEFDGPLILPDWMIP
jgi:hypothetical protein